MKIVYIVLFYLSLCNANAQVTTNYLSFEEYLGIVKKYHPVVKIANLEISQAQATLLMARGAFDPKLISEFDSKNFDNKKYYSLFNSGLKIPTWYGIELKAGFETNTGLYVNPQNIVPENGLAYAGISVPLLQDLLINQRMADIRKAKINISLSAEERKIQAMQVLYEASLAYFNWKKNHDEVTLYQSYFNNATLRLEGIKILVEQGDKAEIDTVEALINVKNRELNLEDSTLKYTKAKLELSNFLWTENNIPLELENNILPEINLHTTIENYFNTNEIELSTFSTESHPKINALNYKIQMLEVDRKLKANQLLPKINVGYNYISNPNNFQSYNFENYKLGISFSTPLFLRKERGSLQLTKQKIEASTFTLNQEKLQLNNKFIAQQTEIKSLKKQNKISIELVENTNQLLKSEERLFSLGESSLFLINTRENNLINAHLNKIQIENRLLLSNAELFRTLSNPK